MATKDEGKGTPAESGAEPPEEKNEQPQDKTGSEGTFVSVTEPEPTVHVLGMMSDRLVLRLGWRSGTISVSQSRFKFMRDDLHIRVIDNPDHYLF